MGEDIIVFAISILTLLLTVLIITKRLKKEKKWEQVYFFLVKEWHNHTPRHWYEIQKDLIDLYGLTKLEANLCIEHWGQSSDWFEDQSWLNDKQDKHKEYERF